MRPARFLTLAAILTLGMEASHAQSPTTREQAPVTPQATFKTGVEVVQLDVSVLDRAGRPVRGLTAGDFSVLENGKPQPIVAFLPVDVPGPVSPVAAWVRDVGPDVVSNNIDTRRLVVIVLDDAYTGIDEGESTRARTIARAIVDELGPADLAAVAFPFLGRAQNFTADRAQLLEAIDSYIPRNWSPAAPLRSFTTTSGGAGPPLGCAFKRGGCLVDLLKHIGTLLETAPPGRKIVMLISTQGTMGVNTDPVEQVNPVQEMFRALQQANVTVFAFDPRGLSLRGRPDDLMSLTDATGGRTIANTNAPEAHVPDVFQQNSAYYLLGFRSDDSRRNGRFRKVEVKVTRPDVQVRTRSGYFAPRDEKPKRSRATPLVRTLEHGIPGRDLPIRLNVAMFGIPGRREAAVTLVASVTDRASASTSRRLEMLATAFDTGWKERATHRQTIDFRTVQADGTDLEFDMLSRLSLRPGRYEVRLAAESDGRVGSVLLNIDVPDFYNDDLSLSGVLLERTSTPVVGNERLLADLVPVTPTAIREFQRGDTVSVFARVYQGGKGSLLPATVTSKIVDASDEIVFERAAAFDAVAFGARRGADYRANLPLSDLRAGHYLLTIEAAAGQGRARRDVRFEVR